MSSCMLSVVLLGLLACTQAFHLKKIRSHNPQLDNIVVNLRRAAAKFGALDCSAKGQADCACTANPCDCCQNISLPMLGSHSVCKHIGFEAAENIIRIDVALDGHVIVSKTRHLGAPGQQEPECAEIEHTGGLVVCLDTTNVTKHNGLLSGCGRLELSFNILGMSLDMGGVNLGCFSLPIAPAPPTSRTRKLASRQGPPTAQLYLNDCQCTGHPCSCCEDNIALPGLGLHTVCKFGGYDASQDLVWINILKDGKGKEKELVYKVIADAAPAPVCEPVAGAPLMRQLQSPFLEVCLHTTSFTKAAKVAWCGELKFKYNFFSMEFPKYPNINAGCMEFPITK